MHALLVDDVLGHCRGMLGIQLSDVVCGEMRWVLISNYMVVCATSADMISGLMPYHAAIARF